MDKDLIDRIYKKKIDIENCDETAKDLLENGTKYITVKFDTWGLKHPFGKGHEIKILTSSLISIVDSDRAEMREEYNNMLNILKGEKD